MCAKAKDTFEDCKSTGIQVYILLQPVKILIIVMDGTAS